MSRPDPPGPVPLLGSREAIAITVGIVIGAGIFKAPSLVAGASDSPATMLLAWALGGAISVVGALCYGELASAYPGPGGDYRYLVRAYGGRVGFLYGWARLAIIQTGSVALLAYVFGDYVASVLPGGAAMWAALAVAGLTALNWLGLRAGTTTQNWLVLVEVLGLIVVIVAGLLFAPALPARAAAPASGEGALGLVLVFVLLTYGGWSEAVYVSAELRDAPRLMWRVLVIGLGAVTLLYLLVNLAYLRGLGLGGMAASDAVAADLMRRVAGSAGAALIAGVVAVAALTSANATIFTGARSSFALGRDVPALGWLGRWDVRRATPGNALLVQGAAALLLVAAGAVARDGFRLAVEYTAPVFWLFFLLVGISLFVLRSREPGLPRPFRVPLYPVLPLIFCLTNAWLLWSSLAYTGWGALVGVTVLGLGALMLPWIDPARHLEPVP
ncbi:APC family permease [uncultured Sphingomonas sp.]|uniref:APC family permease n=1 Tax=uncultured Sphingomonas sp. TaxID=158754 RepID=UPI0035CA48A6